LNALVSLMLRAVGRGATWCLLRTTRFLLFEVWLEEAVLPFRAVAFFAVRAAGFFSPALRFPLAVFPLLAAGFFALLA